MRICPIASGSSGNCIYIGNDNTHILVDAGLSGKKTAEGVNSLGLSMDDISAILVTHEHRDHVGGLGVLARKYHIPIFLTNGTHLDISRAKDLGKIDETLFNDIFPDEVFEISDIKITPIAISHDAAQPVGYRFECDNKKAAIVTDLGVYDDYILNHLQGLDVAMIEANHDINMLQVGPYPYPLKQRILSDNGHLSNEASGKLISAILHDGIKSIYLGHLSHENNLPELAYETVRIEINTSDTPYTGSDFPLHVAKRSEVSFCTEF